jgi:hypothetical protein
MTPLSPGGTRSSVVAFAEPGLLFLDLWVADLHFGQYLVDEVDCP